jgi:aldehyde dehydrogenase (NAD+)
MIQFFNPYIPSVGIGISSLASHHCKSQFIAFSHLKSILDKPFWLEPALKYPPFTKNKLLWIKKLIGIS